MDSSLSMVPPVNASPRPAIIGITIPRDDNIGAKIVPAQSLEVVDTLRRRYSREMPW